MTLADFLRDWGIATELFASNEDAVSSERAAAQKTSVQVWLTNVLPTQAFAETQQVQVDLLYHVGAGASLSDRPASGSYISSEQQKFSKLTQAWIVEKHLLMRQVPS